MKRMICLILIAAMSLTGCAFGRNRMKEPVTFYYLQQREDQESTDRFFFDGAIGSEVREAAGHRDDLNYLLTLYMQGPTDDQLRFPFPIGSKIMEIRTEDGNLTIVMNAISSRFNEMNVTISCACIAKTCMELADVESVTVVSYSLDNRVLFSRTFTNDNLILEDTYTLPSESPEETE